MMPIIAARAIFFDMLAVVAKRGRRRAPIAEKTHGTAVSRPISTVFISPQLPTIVGRKKLRA